MYDGPARGHFSAATTPHNILRAGYHWTTLFKDSHAYTRKCDVYQRSGRKLSKTARPLQPVSILEPFEQWGIYIIGEINPNSSLQHRYILTTTDYFTRWVEAVPLRKVNEDVVINFLQENIITRFGVPISLVFDNAYYFSSIKINPFSCEKGIKLHYLENYYPHGNGLTESTNKNIIEF